jgi:tRNA U34 2-thiouridine synthase MnmA/TrmU
MHLPINDIKILNKIRIEFVKTFRRYITYLEKYYDKIGANIQVVDIEEQFINGVNRFFNIL